MQGSQSVSNTRAAVLRLLVVTHESAVLGPLWAIGESHHWQLESATSGWGAMERVQSGITPDLLVLDLPCGDKDGLHFLRWLRRLRPELPILVLCDSDDAHTQQEAIRLGAQDFLAKPLPEHALERAIGRQLSRAVESSGVEITSEDIAQVGGENFFVAAVLVERPRQEHAKCIYVEAFLGGGGFIDVVRFRKRFPQPRCARERARRHSDLGDHQCADRTSVHDFYQCV